MRHAHVTIQATSVQPSERRCHSRPAGNERLPPYLKAWTSLAKPVVLTPSARVLLAWDSSGALKTSAGGAAAHRFARACGAREAVPAVPGGGRRHPGGEESGGGPNGGDLRAA